MRFGIWPSSREEGSHCGTGLVSGSKSKHRPSSRATEA